MTNLEWNIEEIIFQITSFLHPHEVILLNRVSKQWKRFEKKFLIFQLDGLRKYENSNEKDNFFAQQNNKFKEIF
jgi:hypothetical protein